MTSRNDPAPVVAAAQRVAGVVAARSSGGASARQPLMSLDDERALASGALLAAQLERGVLRLEAGLHDPPA